MANAEMVAAAGKAKPKTPPEVVAQAKGPPLNPPGADDKKATQNTQGPAGPKGKRQPDLAKQDLLTKTLHQVGVDSRSRIHALPAAFKSKAHGAVKASMEALTHTLLSPTASSKELDSAMKAAPPLLQKEPYKSGAVGGAARTAALDMYYAYQALAFKPGSNQPVPYPGLFAHHEPPESSVQDLRYDSSLDCGNVLPEEKEAHLLALGQEVLELGDGITPGSGAPNDASHLADFRDNAQLYLDQLSSAQNESQLTPRLEMQQKHIKTLVEAAQLL